MVTWKFQDKEKSNAEQVRDSATYLQTAGTAKSGSTIP